MSEDIDCTIVFAVAAGANVRDVESSLVSLRTAGAGLRTEVIVVSDAQQLGALQAMAQRFNSAECTVRSVATTSDSLVPERWGAGLRVAIGRAVMFTTSQMHVGPNALTAMHAALRDRVAGAGGPIALPTHHSCNGDALYFARFSSFAVGAYEETRTVAHIPGDNAMYVRNKLAAYVDLNRDAFWEVEYHDRLRRDGFQLALVPDAVATFEARQSLLSMLHERHTHGRHFGMSRVHSGTDGMMRVILAAPLVPVVLLLRAFTRATATAGYGWRFLLASPVLALLFVAWAMGEAAGAAQSRRAA